MTSRAEKDPARFDHHAILFNHQTLLARLMGDHGMIGRAMAIFLREMPKYLVELEKHNSAIDMNEIRVQAHKIKGSAAYIGADGLRDLAREIEDACQRKNHVAVDDLIRGLGKIYSDTRLIMTKYLQENQLYDFE